jgi:hypothetical protein
LKTLSITTVNKLASINNAVKVIKDYHQLIPLVLNAIDLTDDDLIIKGFDTFNEFVELKKIMKPYIPAITEKALIIAADTDLGVNTREQTMYFLGEVARLYSKPLIKAHGMDFVKKIVETGFAIASEPAENYQGGNDDPPPHLAVSMLQGWAIEV